MLQKKSPVRGAANRNASSRKLLGCHTELGQPARAVRYVSAAQQNILQPRIQSCLKVAQNQALWQQLSWTRPSHHSFPTACSSTLYHDKSCCCAETYFCVVDLHAITLPHEPTALLEATRSSAATYIACGIDPEKANIFVQSHVSAHAELAWLLSCGTPIGWLRKMVQFKEKSQTRVGLNDIAVVLSLI